LGEPRRPNTNNIGKNQKNEKPRVFKLTRFPLGGERSPGSPGTGLGKPGEPGTPPGTASKSLGKSWDAKEGWKGLPRPEEA